VVTLFIVLIIAAIVGALIVAAGGLGPRVFRRTTVIERPARRRLVEEEVVEKVPVTRRYVEE
jgi:hypothetical protein